MRTIKKLNLIFGQMLDEEQQSMVLAGGKAPCGCTGVNDCCLSSVDNNLPAYKMVCAQLAKLIVKPGPSGVSISEARDKVESGWAVYLNYCNEASGTLPNAKPEFVHEHWDDFAGKFDGLVNLDYNFLGIDLAATPSSMFSQFPHGGWPMFGLFLLPVIATALQFLMTFVSMKSNGSSGNMNGSSKAMMYMMPLMTLWMGFILPGALSIYWSANAGFSVLQELTLNKYFNKILDREETDKEREKREKRAAKYERQKAMMAEYNNANTSKKKPQQKKQTNGEKRASTNENGRVGQRPYARGRAYSEDHYND